MTYKVSFRSCLAYHEKLDKKIEKHENLSRLAINDLQHRALTERGTMDLQEHLRRLEENRGELLRSIEGLSDKQLTEEPVEGVWSIKAVLDHIAAWEKEILMAAGEIAAGKRPSLMDIQDFDACNARFVEERKQRSIQQTLEELATARQAFIQGLKGLPQDLWQNETLQYLVKVIWEHDDAHGGTIRSWREGLKR